MTPNFLYFKASFLQFWLLAFEIVFMLLIVLKLFRELRWLCRNGLIEWLASARVELPTRRALPHTPHVSPLTSRTSRYRCGTSLTPSTA